MLKRILLVLLGALVLALAALAAMAAGRPDHFEVRRSVRIAAPPAAIHPLIADLRTFNRWNPFARKDPAMALNYRGPASGPGAAYDFASDKAGTGSITLTGGQAPGTVTMRLDMREPLAGSNEIVFALVPQGPQGEATEVSWTMRGASPFVARLIGVVFDMDAMIGRDFAAGLADLKALAERR